MVLSIVLIMMLTGTFVSSLEKFKRNSGCTDVQVLPEKATDTVTFKSRKGAFQIKPTDTLTHIDITLEVWSTPSNSSRRVRHPFTLKGLCIGDNSKWHDIDIIAFKEEFGMKQWVIHASNGNCTISVSTKFACNENCFRKLRVTSPRRSLRRYKEPLSDCLTNTSFVRIFVPSAVVSVLTIIAVVVVVVVLWRRRKTTSGSMVELTDVDGDRIATGRTSSARRESPLYLEPRKLPPGVEPCQSHNFSTYPDNSIYSHISCHDPQCRVSTCNLKAHYDDVAAVVQSGEPLYIDVSAGNEVGNVHTNPDSNIYSLIPCNNPHCRVSRCNLKAHYDDVAVVVHSKEPLYNNVSAGNEVGYLHANPDSNFYSRISCNNPHCRLSRCNLKAHYDDVAAVMHSEEPLYINVSAGNEVGYVHTNPDSNIYSRISCNNPQCCVSRCNLKANYNDVAAVVQSGEPLYNNVSADNEVVNVHTNPNRNIHSRIS